MKPAQAYASLEQLKKDIKTGELRRVYLLFGEERYLRNFYEKKLIEALGGSRDDMNTTFFDSSNVSASAIIDQAQTLPFFADRRIIVVRYSGYFSVSCDELADYISEAPETTTFVFVEDKADARLKLYKKVSDLGLVVEFITQTERYLLQNIGAYFKKNEKRISEADAGYLLDIVGSDMGRLMSELEKLVSFKIDADVITREDIDAICSRNIEDRIFEMIDAIMRADIKTCMERYDDLLALKVAPMQIIIMLEKQFLWMLQIKSLKESGNYLPAIKDILTGKNEADPETGAVKKVKGSITGFQVEKYYEQSVLMDIPKLQRSVALCAGADEDVKTGRMNEKTAAESLMVKLIAGK